MRLPAALLAIAVTMTTTRCATSAPTRARIDAPPIAWSRWDKATFERARAERRIVVVTIATQWCHWCHVMDEETWSDPEVRALVDARFVAVREDADARPDLAERYADWGWPAIALLTPEGKPVAELRGFQDKRTFLPFLRELTAKLDAGRPLERTQPAIAAAAHAPDEVDAALARIRPVVDAQLARYWDEAQGGWGRPQKYPFWAQIESAIVRGALTGDAEATRRGLFTLAQARGLIDPVDGGVFQYSLDGVWTAPHYEKLAELNGALPGSYALAVTAASSSEAPPLTRDDAIAAGRMVHEWLTTTMRAPSGAFYANQDADVGTRGERPHMVGKRYYALDAAARAQAGAPFVDTHVYASHNGRVIAGLARFAGAAGDDALLADAVGAADAIVATHWTPRGFTHAPAGDGGDGLLHIADQVAMGHALVELYEATGDARWRERARETTRALVAALWDEARGAFLAHTVDASTPAIDVRAPFRGNAEAARLVMKVGRLEEDAALVALGKRALASFAAEPIVAEEGRIVGEYLLAIDEALAEPLHFALVAAPGQDVAQLRKAALAVHAPHRLVDVHAPGKKYPDLGKPALYVCGATFCSPPITDPAVVAKKAAPFLKPRA